MVLTSLSLQFRVPTRALLTPAAALLACYFSARRATKISPLTALRSE